MLLLVPAGRPEPRARFARRVLVVEWFAVVQMRSFASLVSRFESSMLAVATWLAVER